MRFPVHRAVRQGGQAIHIKHRTCKGKGLSRRASSIAKMLTHTRCSYPVPLLGLTMLIYSTSFRLLYLKNINGY
jgi:hypothetical protein